MRIKKEIQFKFYLEMIKVKRRSSRSYTKTEKIVVKGVNVRKNMLKLENKEKKAEYYQ